MKVSCRHNEVSCNVAIDTVGCASETDLICYTFCPVKSEFCPKNPSLARCQDIIEVTSENLCNYETNCFHNKNFTLGGKQTT